MREHKETVITLMRGRKGGRGGGREGGEGGREGVREHKETVITLIGDVTGSVVLKITEKSKQN